MGGESLHIVYVNQVNNKIDGAGATLLFYCMHPYERLQQQLLSLLLSRKSILLILAAANGKEDLVSMLAT